MHVAFIIKLRNLSGCGCLVKGIKVVHGSFSWL